MRAEGSRERTVWGLRVHVFVCGVRDEDDVFLCLGWGERVVKSDGAWGVWFSMGRRVFFSFPFEDRMRKANATSSRQAAA